MKSAKRSSVSCSEMDEYIAKFISEQLTDNEYELFLSHLQDCGNCRNILNTLEMLPEVLRVPGETNIPHPSLPDTVKDRLRSTGKSLHTKSYPLPEMVRNFLTHRIPVYQAILLAAAILLLTFILWKPGSGVRENRFPPNAVTQEDSTRQLNANPEPSAARIGRTIEEDSSLTRFMISIM